MGRLGHLLVASLFVVGCGAATSDSADKATEGPREGTRSASAAVRPSACRLDGVATLARSLESAGPRARRTLVATGLPESCDLPEAFDAFFVSTATARGDEALAAKAARSEIAMLASICEHGDEVTRALVELPPPKRAPAMFDRCGFGRLGLADREAWLRSGATSGMPFVALHWLREQGVPERDAKPIADAMWLRARAVWGSPGQRIPVLGGTLPPVPLHAIEVAVTPEEVRVAGASVLELAKGALPEGEAGEDATKTLRDALLAELEASPQDEETPMVLVVDERIPIATLLRVDAMMREAGPSAGIVAQTEPLAFGLIAFETTEHRSLGTPALEIDAKGFELTPPSGGAKQRIGDGAQTPYDFELLAARAEERAGSGDAPTAVVVRPDHDVSAGVLLNALHRLRGERCSDDPTRCWFEQIQVQTGTDHRRLAAKAGLLGLMAKIEPEEGLIGIGAGLGDEDVWGGLAGGELGDGVGGLLGAGDDFGSLGGADWGGGGGGGGTGSSGKKRPRVRQSKPTVKGSLPKDTIRRIVRLHISEVRHCYNNALSKEPDLEGKIMLSFVIGTSGRVASAKVKSNTLGNEDVGECLVKVAKRWTFPEPAGDGIVVVNYPFTFTPG
ncbi:MAG: TonB family protein [Nannocystaceae bacterium]|nr:TonB family protein [bacterium]